MNPQPHIHSAAWKSFSYVSFVVACAMTVVGIVLLPIDFWMKGYLGMAALMLVQTAVTMTKTQRDFHEASKLVNRIEDARTEKLLMEVGKPG